MEQMLNQEDESYLVEADKEDIIESVHRSTKEVGVENALLIRRKNYSIITSSPNKSQRERYEVIQKETGFSEWTVRWICQGREYTDAGGFIEGIQGHEGSKSRAFEENEIIISIREKFNTKQCSIWRLADQYAVSDTTIRRIILGKTYRDIGGPIVDESFIERCDEPRPSGSIQKRNNHRSSLLAKQQALSAQPKTLITSNSSTEKNDVREMTMAEKSLAGLEVFYIRNAFKNGRSVQELSIRYNIPEESVVDVVRGNIHSRVPGPISGEK